VVDSDAIGYYSFHGQQYTIDVASPEQGASMVMVDPEDPSNAVFGKPVTRSIEGALVGGPYTASVLLLIAGFARTSRQKHQRERGPRPTFGIGLDQGRRVDSWSVSVMPKFLGGTWHDQPIIGRDGSNEEATRPTVPTPRSSSGERQNND